MAELSEQHKDNGGRPPKFKNTYDLQKKIDEYFEGGIDTTTKVIGNKKDGYQEIEVPCLTLTGLALHLGFCSRQSLYDYEKKPEFSYSIKRARTLIEREYEQLLVTGNPVGAIFALKNFGWKDKQEIKQDIDLKSKDLEEFDSIYDKVRKGIK